MCCFVISKYKSVLRLNDNLLAAYQSFFVTLGRSALARRRRDYTLTSKNETMPFAAWAVQRLRINLPFLLLLLVVQATPALAVAVGSASAEHGVINGFAFDPAASTTPITIAVYRDGPIGSGVRSASFTTQSFSKSNASYGITGNHGFNWMLPAKYSDSLHIWFVYGIDNRGKANLLSNTPVVYPNVTANAAGASQYVYKNSAQSCDSMDFPDHPPRAFRTADGNVNLISSWVNVRRAVGPTLDSVTHQCNILHHPAGDTNFQDFNYWQWLQGPYTLDGKTIYNVTHMEWYGALVDGTCGTDDIDSWVSAITLTISADMGNTFSAPGDYIIRHPSTPWNNSFTCTSSNPTRYGDLGGSNVISKDGYFYKFFYYETEPGVTPTGGWQCVMRTKNLASASSWKTWTNAGWTSTKAGACAPVSGVSNMRSVTYNTYLGLYIGIQYLGSQGFVFNLSRDLLNWSTSYPIATPGLNTATTPYPALLDPKDTSLNFERTGQQPYLYYAQTHPNTFANDLMRVAVQFSLNY